MPHNIARKRAPPRVLLLDAEFSVVLQDGAADIVSEQVRARAKQMVADGIESAETAIAGAAARMHVAKLTGGGLLRYALFIEPRGARKPLTEAYDRFRLSAREVEVLSLIVEGASNKEIASVLSIAETTVQDHVRHLVGKSGARRRGDLLARVFGIDTAG